MCDLRTDFLKEPTSRLLRLSILLISTFLVLLGVFCRIKLLYFWAFCYLN